MITLNDKIREYCKLQRTGYGDLSNDNFDLTYYNDISKDINDIKKYLLDKNNINICDIGCGIGGIDLLIYQQFNINHMTLIDKNGKSSDIYYGFKDQASYYNDITLTKSLLKENNVPIEKVSYIDINNDSLPMNIKYDVIISILSLSFHYPFSTYSDFINKTLKENGILILDVRDNTTELENILTHFKGCEVIKKYKKNKRIAFYK